VDVVPGIEYGGMTETACELKLELELELDTIELSAGVKVELADEEEDKELEGGALELDSTTLVDDGDGVGRLVEDDDEGAGVELVDAATDEEEEGRLELL
jgi:hypothetical protein